MTTSEHIFLKTETSAAIVAETIAHALDMEAAQKDSKVAIRGDGIDNIPGPIRGTLGPNTYSNIDDPDNSSIFDHHQIVWEIWRPHSDEETQLATAQAIFRKLIDNVGWPIILMHDIDLLIADWNPERGLREFPAGTTPYDTDITA